MKILEFKKKTFDVVEFARNKLRENGIDMSDHYDSDDEFDFCYNCNQELMGWYSFCPKCGKKLTGNDN